MDLKRIIVSFLLICKKFFIKISGWNWCAHLVTATDKVVAMARQTTLKWYNRHCLLKKVFTRYMSATIILRAWIRWIDDVSRT